VNREQKAAVIDEVAGQIEEAGAIFAVDYRGISVTQAAELRTKLDDAGASFRVVKNRLTILAADKAGAEDLKEYLVGPTAFTFVSGDVALAAKALSTFKRETDLLEFKGGRMDGEPLTADEILAIARLPGREQLQAQFVGVLASPLTGLVRGLNSLIAGLAVQLQQIADQGLVSGEAPAAEAPASADETAAGEEEPEAEAPSEEPAAEEAETPSDEAPGDPVAEAETAEEETSEETSETPSEGDDQEKEG
jgi:large subunit ribosomal protein L10